MSGLQEEGKIEGTTQQEQKKIDWNEYLKTYKLEHLIKIFENNHIEMDYLLVLNENELDDCCKELKISKIEFVRLKAALSKIETSQIYQKLLKKESNEQTQQNENENNNKNINN